ncbi:hypothetical protein DFP72DRAFT_1172807 [Ephemerocybe angulata]|uniref:Uncharacterized protein n=1 Tax=Ephemerocybe angulata TaxID=980116 RepID=A0A8H6M038_9AGAR|nr:hypothetical protein DFP72DRAFT_1172807 [Tulosesus angulatus]
MPSHSTTHPIVTAPYQHYMEGREPWEKGTKSQENELTKPQSRQCRPRCRRTSWLEESNGVAESNGNITGIGAKLPVQPTSSSSSPSASLASTYNQREGAGFRSEAVRPCPKTETGELPVCLQPRPAISSPSSAYDTHLLCHAWDPSHASAPASVIELASLSFLYASASVLNDLPCIITFLSTPTLKSAFGGAVNEISSWGRTVHHDLVFAPSSASASLASMDASSPTASPQL